MTKEEFNEEMELLKKEHNSKVNTLYKKCAASNNPHKVDDIITDDIGSIKIESISVNFSYNSNFPQCVYNGVELKKDLTPVKRGTKRNVWQCNIIK